MPCLLFRQVSTSLTLDRYNSASLYTGAGPYSLESSAAERRHILSLSCWLCYRTCDYLLDL